MGKAASVGQGSWRWRTGGSEYLMNSHFLKSHKSCHLKERADFPTSQSSSHYSLSSFLLYQNHEVLLIFALYLESDSSYSHWSACLDDCYSLLTTPLVSGLVLSQFIIHRALSIASASAVSLLLSILHYTYWFMCLAPSLYWEPLDGKNCVLFIFESPASCTGSDT